MAALSCLIQIFFVFTLSILTELCEKRKTELMQTLRYCCRVNRLWELSKEEWDAIWLWFWCRVHI
ncbi:hypothetical protein Hanom_Chr07g00622351 [Helianthus anomalus]